MKILPLPSQAELQESLEYNKSNGTLKWIKRRIGRKFGKKAGYLKTTGYVVIGFNGKSYKIHRIIYKLLTGKE